MRTKNLFLACCLAVTTVIGCSGSDGQPGTTGTAGVTGTVGTPGANGSDGTNGTNGSNGANGANGEAGAPGSQGAPGDTGETGATGDSGVSLCGDVQMPEWHQPCGAELVGACATTNARWECHLFLTSGPSGDVTQDLSKVCADATTHVVVSVPSSSGANYPHSPVAVTSNRCDQDADCDGVLDRLTDTVSYGGDSNSVQVSVGTVVSFSGGDSQSIVCLSGTAACDTTCGRIKVVFSPVAGSDTLGADCFNPATTLEGSMGCGLNGTWVNPDYDQDGTDWVCESEGNLVLGQAAVSCVAPSHDAHVCVTP